MIDVLPQQQKALPHSEESERAVLGGVMLDPSVLPTISGRLRAEDFYSERHQLLYQAMLDLREEQVETDLRTLQARLEQRGQLEMVGGLAI
jgi:replicative DNA helicase